MMAAALSFSPQAVAEPVHHGVAAGRLVVSQVPGLDDNTNAVVTLVQSINNFQIGSYNRGDYAVRIGVGMLAAEDSARGVLMASVAENGRNNFGPTVIRPVPWKEFGRRVADLNRVGRQRRNTTSMSPGVVSL